MTQRDRESSGLIEADGRYLHCQSSIWDPFLKSQYAAFSGSRCSSPERSVSEPLGNHCESSPRRGAPRSNPHSVSYSLFQPCSVLAGSTSDHVRLPMQIREGAQFEACFQQAGFLLRRYSPWEMLNVSTEKFPFQKGNPACRQIGFDWHSHPRGRSRNNAHEWARQTPVPPCSQQHYSQEPPSAVSG